MINVAGNVVRGFGFSSAIQRFDIIYTFGMNRWNIVYRSSETAPFGSNKGRASFHFTFIVILFKMSDYCFQPLQSHAFIRKKGLFEGIYTPLIRLDIISDLETTLAQ
jgi:hypothetical protein